MPVTVTIPEDAGNVTYQWYIGSTKIADATSNTYTPKNSDIGKNLNVHVIPTDANSPYKNVDDAATGNYVSSHHYSNGFCSVCGEYEKPSLSSDGYYEIDNGGKMFWFAAHINGDTTHAEDATLNPENINARLMKDISLNNPNSGNSTEWTPIGETSGSGTNAFTGTFDGQGHTISELSITTLPSGAVRTGLFGTIKNAQVMNFTVKGSITLSTGNYGNNSGVGGAIGCALGQTTVSDVTSCVNISNSAGELHHVGGVVGGTNYVQDTDTVTIRRCVYEIGSTINVSNSTDCIGGVVGYANNGTTISYCANRGTVSAKQSGAYTGGVLGYLNNSNITVRNCYNYGSVQNGGGNYCGAIVGRLRTHTDSKLTDNYYLTGSASSAFGAGSNSTSSTAPAKSAAVFASGEVCYLVNGKITLAKDGAVWMQDVDNDNTPYDQYPVFDADPVYYRSDHTYSNDPERISVTVSWGSMAFTCTQEWDPDTHVNTVTWAPAEDKVSNAFTVKNDSNVKVNVTPTFQAVDAVLSGTVSGLTGSALDKGASETGILSLASTSVPPSLTTSPKKIGTLTITVSALYQS